MRRTKAPADRTARTEPAAEPVPLADVFISYARTDQAIAANVADTLRSEGFDVWFDSRIYAGAEWKSLLMSTLASAKAVLVLWSARSVKRPWVLKEARIAQDTRRLVPVKIDDCALPPRFAAQQTAMMPGWNGTDHHPELERVLAGLARLAPPSRVDTVRPGFDPAFLGVPIDLPAVTGVAEEFRYLHFSVVMNPARRLAWYVAYNMAVRADVVRGDRWMPDPALPLSFQPQNEHFSGTGLDRGHLAAPSSVSWGPERQAQLANHQAFFWTNTVPQHPDLNRGWWLSVELWERELVAQVGRLAGFAGAVLAESDPIHRDVEQVIGRLRVRQNFRLPQRFWKIVVNADAKGGLVVAPFLWEPAALAKRRMPLRANPAEFLSTVAAIEALTGLDFGEAIRGAPRREGFG
jgi:DNA/RNA endonuclease G (NUC1)